MAAKNPTVVTPRLEKAANECSY